MNDIVLVLSLRFDIWCEDEMLGLISSVSPGGRDWAGLARVSSGLDNISAGTGDLQISHLKIIFIAYANVI